MIRLRFPTLLSVAFVSIQALGAAEVAPEIPTRKAVIVQRTIPAGEAAAKLPPPVAPGIDGSRSAVRKVEAVAVALEKGTNGPAIVKRPAANPAEERKLRIAADRERLNQNALKWQQERAEQGSASATRSLAMRYLRADGVERDISRGIELLRKAAAGGDTIAQAELSKLGPAKEE